MSALQACVKGRWGKGQVGLVRNVEPALPGFAHYQM
jgi:hypothetical protein